MEKSRFCALAGPPRQVRWLDKFKTSNIDRYDGFNNLKNLFRYIRPSLRLPRGRSGECQLSTHNVDRRNQIVAHQFT
jgi:hypothetical protein